MIQYYRVLFFIGYATFGFASDVVLTSDLAIKHNPALVSHLAECVEKYNDEFLFTKAVCQKSWDCIYGMAALAKEYKVDLLGDYLILLKQVTTRAPEMQAEITTYMKEPVYHNFIGSAVYKEGSLAAHPFHQADICLQSASETNVVIASKHGDFSFCNVATCLKEKKFSHAGRNQNPNHDNIGHTQQVEYVSYVPRTDWVLSYSQDKRLKLWDKESAQPYKTIGKSVSPGLLSWYLDKEKALCLAFIDNKMLYAAPALKLDNAKQVCNVGRETKELAVVASTDSFFCLQQDGSIDLYKSCNPNHLYHLFYQNPVTDISVSTYDLIAKGNKFFSIYDSKKDKRVAHCDVGFYIHKVIPASVAKDKGWYIVCGLSQVYTYDRKMAEYNTLISNDMIKDVQVVEEEEPLCCVQTDNDITIWNVASHQKVHTFDHGIRWIVNMSISDSYKYPFLLCTIRDESVDRSSEHKLFVYNYKTGQCYATAPVSFDKAHACRVNNNGTFRFIFSSERSQNFLYVHDIISQSQDKEIQSLIKAPLTLQELRALEYAYSIPRNDNQERRVKIQEDLSSQARSFLAKYVWGKEIASNKEGQ